MGTLQKFCEISTMHGYIEMYYAKCWFWRIFWALVIAGSIGVTSYQVYSAVNQFLKQSAYTAIEPAKGDEVLYPPLKYCLYHWTYWLDSSTETFKEFGYNAVLYGLSYTGIAYTRQKIKNFTDAANSFNTKYKKANFTTITDFYKAIARPAEKMFTLSNDYYSADESMSLSSKLFTEIDFVIWRNKWLLCYVAPGEKIKSFLKELKAGTEERNIIELKYGKKVDIDSTILPLEYNAYMYEWVMEGKFVNPGQNSLRLSGGQLASRYELFNMPKIFFVNGFSETYLYIKEEDRILTYFIKVKGTANVWNNNPTNDCVKSFRAIESNQTCSQTCKEEATEIVRKIKSKKQCTFIENGLFLIKRKEDTIDNICKHKILEINNFYDGENKTIDNFDKDDYKLIEDKKKNCSVNCVKACEIWAFNFDTITASFDTELLKDGYGVAAAMNGMGRGGYGQESIIKDTTINIEYPLDGTILVMTETSSQTWENFVGNIGGLLGIWTGASILSLLQLVYLCCFADTCSSCVTNNVQQPIPTQVYENRQVPVKKIQHFDMKTIHVTEPAQRKAIYYP